MSDVKVEEVVNIIKDAGGMIVGRTRLQKISYLLTATGLDNNFSFVYKYFGPYSEQLAFSARFGTLFGKLTESSEKTNWGASYSTYTVDCADCEHRADDLTPRQSLATIAAEADAVVLELAATALFLHHDGSDNPWEETAQRKPVKFNEERHQKAIELLQDLASIEGVEKPIPQALFEPETLVAGA